LKILKSDIEKLIKVKKKDSFINHFFTIINLDYKPNGEVGKNEIKFWKFNLWIAIFYPIFIFKLNSKKEVTSINSKLNSFGKLIYVLFFILLTSFFKDINFTTINVSSIFFIVLIYLLFISLFILLSFKIYNLEKKNQLESIYKELNKNTQQ
jgi:hypothetical protein